MRYMDNKTVKQLREIAKEIGLRGFWKLRKADLINLIEQSERALRRVEGGSLLDEPIPENEIPRRQTILKPSKAKKIDKTVNWRKREVENWGEWLKRTDVPRVVVSDALESFKAHIAELYKMKLLNFKLVESKSALKKFAVQYTIDGVKGYDPRSQRDCYQLLERTPQHKIQAYPQMYDKNKHSDGGSSKLTYSISIKRRDKPRKL